MRTHSSHVTASGAFSLVLLQFLLMWRGDGIHIRYSMAVY